MLDDDLEFPISPENSVLDSFGSFSRQSPCPTPSRLDFTWSSGNIPVILYDNAYADERRSSPFAFDNSRRETVMTLGSDTNPVFSLRFSTGSRASLVNRNRESVVISSSASSDTIRSAATFGARKQPAVSIVETRHFARDRQSCSSSESTIAQDYGTGEAALDDACFSPDTVFHSVSNHSSSPRTSREYDTQRLNIGGWYSISSIERASTPSESTCVEPPSPATRASISVEGDNDNSGDVKRSPSAQSWLSISQWDLRGRKTLEVDVTEAEVMHVAPPAGGMLESQQSVSEITSSLPFRILESVQDHTLFPFESPSVSATHGFDAFLKATVVHFLVDQEGFRDAEPSFKFCGISRVRSSEETKTQARVMAQFRPVSRQQFLFHHAPFESPPVLRRITINNDDTSDYVSRQAHLTLKSNGVYVIHGHEMSSAESASEQTKLYWQFEYLVDDRRVESSGSRRDLEGEKTFTPLTFSCSPRLLLPSQAKRINIMHVFKKSLAPKLVSEKLQVRLGAQRSANSPSPENPLSSKIPHYKNTGSHGSRALGDGAPNRRAVSDHVLVGSHAGRQSAYESQPLSRFSTPSALSVSREDEQGSNGNIIDINPLFLPRGSPAASADHRHIVDPARLSELLIQDSSSKESSHAQGRYSGAPDSSIRRSRERDSEAFVELSPRPKRSL